MTYCVDLVSSTETGMLGDAQDYVAGASRVRYMQGAPRDEASRNYRPWVDIAFQTIYRFRDLPRGWDSYDAEPPNEVSKVQATAALVILDSMEFAPSRVAPSVEGGIVMTWDRPGKYANIEFFNSGEVLIALRAADGNPLVREVGLDDIETALCDIRDYINA